MAIVSRCENNGLFLFWKIFDPLKGIETLTDSKKEETQRIDPLS